MRIRKKPLGDKNLVGARIESIRRNRGMKQKELLAQLQVRGVDINANRVHAVFHHRIQRARQPGQVAGGPQQAARIRAGGQLRPDYLAVNPLGKVPVRCADRAGFIVGRSGGQVHRPRAEDGSRCDNQTYPGA